jgi:hypothetical protein
VARRTWLAGVVRGAAVAAAAAVLAPCASWAEIPGRLETAGFSITPGAAADFVSAYQAVGTAGHPAFVTTDCALALTRAVLEETLISIEEDGLYDRLADLSRALVRLSEEQYLRATDPSAREAARKNIAFFAVPLSLLDPDYFPPESARGLVERELALIEAGEGVTLSPIMGSTPLDGVVGPGEDYGAYVPRGRAAYDERLGRLHRAITWYSRMAFALPEGRVLDNGLTMQALLLARAMEGEAGDWLEVWERIYDPLLFYLGGSGDPTIKDYIEIAGEVFGEDYDVDDVANQERLTSFIELVGKVAPPHFETHELRGMRFLARPTLPDTRYFARLAGSADTPLPTGLDLAGLLGSTWARSALEERDAFASDLYRRGFEDIRQELEGMTYGEWTHDMPTSWLYALEVLAQAPPPGSPAFATAPSWGAKEASTIAAGWALLRRAPVGFAAPPSKGGAPPDTGAAAPGEASVLVEPYPLLYARLRELVEHVRDRLWENYLLDDRLASLLATHRDFLTSLERLSEGALSRDARRLDARGPGGLSGGIPGYVADLERGVLPGGSAGNAHGDAFVAPVFEDLVSGRSLAAAVGRPDAIRALLRGADGSVVYGGAVFSYYEFEASSVERLTPVKWARQLEGAATAERPWWLEDLVEEE